MQISGRPSRTSSFVTAKDDSPLTRTAYRTNNASYQPQRRARPVVAPNSFPWHCNTEPVSSLNSDGNGPLPTRVVYALATPRTPSITVGPMPVPVQAPPAAELDDVTKG